MSGRVQPHLLGYPRIGPRRELKWALEARWRGDIDGAELADRLVTIRSAHLAEQEDLVGRATDDLFTYDAALETAIQFGLVPDWASDEDPFDVVTALARGTADHEAWEMTKWFDTNYHYVVPEIDRVPTAFDPLPWRAPIAGTTWVVVGPYSLVGLSKVGVDRRELARSLGDLLLAFARTLPAGTRLQLDEPLLGLRPVDTELLAAAYGGWEPLADRPRPYVSVQFGTADPTTIDLLSRRGLVVQVPADRVDRLPDREVAPEVLVAVADGRSVWPDAIGDHEATLRRLAAERRLTITHTTSLLFLPYTVEGEALPPGFQFAREKARHLAAWAKALSGGSRPVDPTVVVPAFPEPGRLRRRATRAERRAAQSDLELPPFPTTTTGSLPQTGEVRRLRARLRRGEIDQATYEAAIDDRIRDAIAWQEAHDLDVLVHGEFERSDMVEYFAERMDGFLTTTDGWVLSYGSRCTRPPILAAPPRIDRPMTVREWRVAQAATERPVKGMLTGPVTIVNWSFRPPGVSDDRLFWAVAGPIAEEVGHLVDAGARIVQIDEPAVRERWPLPTEDAQERRAVYARGVRAALNRVFDAPVHVQLHTHMCYGDFGDIVDLWADAGVDVASIEFSRSKDASYIEAFYGLFEDGHLQIGPGAFDVHSPHSPGAGVMADRLAAFLDVLDPADLWVNPDCGLKTRSWADIEVQLADMVAAARRLRARSADLGRAGDGEARAGALGVTG